MMKGRNRKDILLLCSLFLGVPFVLLLPWLVYNANIPVPSWEKEFDLSYLAYTHLQTQFYKIPLIFEAFSKTLFLPGSHNILWILLLVTLLLFKKNSFLFPQLFFILLITLNILALLTATFIFPFEWWYGVAYEYPRLLMVNVPLALYFISYQLKQAY